MDGLSRVNLLVGKNNSGKTALLEGLQFLTSGGDPAVLGEVAERRGEIIIQRQEPTVLADIAHFFHGHALEENQAVNFTGDNGYPAVGLKFVLVQKESGTSTAPPPSRGGMGVPYLRITGPKPRGERDEIGFFVTRDGGVRLESPARARRTSAVRRTISDNQVLFIGPDSLSSVDLASMWDEITLSGQEQEVAKAMSVIESDVESVHVLIGMFVQGYFPARGGIVVATRGTSARLPLGSMGDGMRRMMALAVSLAYTKDGCLFIDEIDTGLHYSVMADMWKLVIAKAAASNAQVFATTHSWDCIEGLSLVCQREPELLSHVALHKIDRGLPNSIAFTGESIVRMIKRDIDPRS